ncbi:MAG: DNA polymerase III subunit delta, partial [Planctomycetes bacterium]|nr:DNA polymerase III subunit delta [Planctomycetota bacterium]
YREALEDYAAKPSPTGVLLIECKSMPGNTRLAKLIAKVGQVLKFEPMPAYKVPGWLATWCREAYGVQIDNNAALKLCDLIGPELGLLDAEVQKCAIYIAGRARITLADVEALVGQQREEQVWNILSAIGAGDEQRALQLWEEVCQTDRAAEARAIGGLAFTVRRLLKAKRAEEAGASPQELKGILWVRDDPTLRRELGAFTTAQVEEILTRLLEADVAAKTGRASVQASVEKLIVEMSRRRGPRRAVG